MKETKIKVDVDEKVAAMCKDQRRVERYLDYAESVLKRYNWSMLDLDELRGLIYESLVLAVSRIDEKFNDDQIDSYVKLRINNTIVDYIRSVYKLGRIVVDIEVDFDKFGVEDPGFKLIEFFDLIKVVDEKTRKMIIMKFYEGRTYDEIARKTGVTKQRVGQIVKAGLKTIKRKGL